MGGNALKHVGVERKSRENYFYLSGNVLAALGRLFPNTRKVLIKTYAAKESFGDSDILLESNNLPPNWHDMIREEFKPQDMVANGGVLSFDFNKMQVDLITAPSHEFDFAEAYFAFNDLGNFMGRVANKMGFKFGHNGLWKMARDAEGNKIDDVLVSLDLPQVFRFLGYDYSRFMQGFIILEDVFEFAASTPYFHRQIFQLDNRNAVSRVRDAKRASYTAFLKWIEDKPELDRWEWSSYTGDKPSDQRDRERGWWLQEAFLFYDFRDRYLAVLKKHALYQQFKAVWNGDVVRVISGFTGKELGNFIIFCKNSYSNNSYFNQTDVTFEQWVLNQDVTGIEAFIRERKVKFEQSQ